VKNLYNENQKKKKKLKKEIVEDTRRWKDSPLTELIL
jgi:hypothetical protein